MTLSSLSGSGWHGAKCACGQCVLPEPLVTWRMFNRVLGIGLTGYYVLVMVTAIVVYCLGLSVVLHLLVLLLDLVSFLVIGVLHYALTRPQALATRLYQVCTIASVVLHLFVVLYLYAFNDRIWQVSTTPGPFTTTLVFVFEVAYLTANGVLCAFITLHYRRNGFISYRAKPDQSRSNSSISKSHSVSDILGHESVQKSVTELAKQVDLYVASIDQWRPVNTSQ